MKTTVLESKPAVNTFSFKSALTLFLQFFKSFNGGRAELVALSALALGLLPTAALAFPNPLMPAQVSLYHFWEVSLSNGLFGALCAWFVATKVAMK